MPNFRRRIIKQIFYFISVLFVSKNFARAANQTENNQLNITDNSSEDSALPVSHINSLVNKNEALESFLIQKLSFPDALKFIGRCPSISRLREIEPSVTFQYIEVVSYYDDWHNKYYIPSGGGAFYYDHQDKITEDDGGSCIVTKNGARWKRKILGVVNIQDFGARGNGTFVRGSVSGDDDSDAFYNALNYACSMNVQSSATNTIMTVSIRIDSNNGFFIIRKKRKFIGDMQFQHRRLGLKYFSEGRATIYFDNNEDDAELIYNNNQFLFIRFYGLRFESNSFGSICHYSYGDGGAQDCYYFDCDFDGVWKFLLKLRGKNNNSEIGWEKCAVTGRFVTLWDIDESDQFLNYWAHKCKFWLYRGAHIDARRGGHFKFVDCDWSGLGDEEERIYSLFKLSHSDHARGVCDFRIINGRFEFKNIKTSLIDCSWNYGNVELVIDLSSQASLQLSNSDMFIFRKNCTSGPKVTIRDSQICGKLNLIDTSSDFFSPNSVSIENSQFWFVDDLSNVIYFDNLKVNSWFCRVDKCMVFKNNHFNSEYSIYSIDGNYYPTAYKYGQPKEFLSSMLLSDGIFPNKNREILLHLPKGAIITTVIINIDNLSEVDHEEIKYELVDNDGEVLGIFGIKNSQKMTVIPINLLLNQSHDFLRYRCHNDTDLVIKGECIVKYI